MQQATQLQVSPSGQSPYQPVRNLQGKAGTLRPQLQVSPSGKSSYQPVPNLQDKVGTPHPQLQVSLSGQSSYQPVRNLQGKAGTLRPQPQHEPPASKETLLQQPGKDKMVTHRIPRLRAVVESQAFKNVLVDEMDMMLSHAATLIQAKWRGYRLRQKLISQMMVAKAIQEAWRCFNTRCLLQSGKTVEKKAKVEEGDIPYHPPQQVRFQHPEEGKSLLAQPTMVSKETQFPSSNSLAAYTHQLALLQSQGMSQPGTCSVGGPSVAFLPHQTVAIRLPCPVSLEAKCRPCLVTRTVRNACLVHVEGDTMKTKPHPRCSPQARLLAELTKPLSQAHVSTKLTKGPSQGHPPPELTTALAQSHLGMCLSKVQSQAHLPTKLTQAQSQARLATETAKSLHAARQATELSSKTQSQPLLVEFKASTQPRQHIGALPRAKPEDRLTQLLSHSYVQGQATQGPRQGASETQNVLVPLLASAGHTTCHVESWGDRGAAWAQPSTTSPAPPCQEELGPEDAGVSGGQAWNSAPARSTVPWDVMAAVDPRQPVELVASVQAAEKIIIHAVGIIQACTRGFLVRRTIKVWHQWAITIQAAWRGYCVRRDLARLCRAATIIQAAWRGFCTRRSCTQQMLLPGMWAEMGSGARTTSDHRCFQSCRLQVCSLCQSLSSGLGSPPSVVMLVGSSSRTCHMCGHTQPTRVVHGTGQGAAGQAGMPRGCTTQSNPRSPQQPHHQNKAATAIQSAWRGFTVRCRLKQQQLAAKMLQATWRGHCTRASLTTDALLGPAAWDNSQHTQWPGV
uniref:IQ domain-containing protein N n=1 Tax=Balaenoptera musculus TaxID=9771 RepID=A0A8C0CIT1_BALMU